MYGLLGKIVERVENRTWEELIKEKVFSPLEMNSSNCSVQSLLKSDNAALGYSMKIKQKEPYQKLSMLASAGAINSTINDMAHWLMTWLNDGKYKGKIILPLSYVDKLISSIGKEDYNHGRNLGYYKGLDILEHGGNINGFTSRVILFPKQEMGIVVLANQSHSLLPRAVAYTVSDAVLNLKSTNWIGELGIE